MSDYTPSQPPPDPENLVSQVVEQAAKKVAQAAQATPPAQPRADGTPVMGQSEARLVVAALLLVMLASLLLTIQIKNRLVTHASEFRQLCETVAEQNPNTDPVTKAKAISACSKPE